ncbi:MAG: hypothetical protein COW67_02975 [Flavobacteriales bacterium CG18_big_fil_WC_8_21_14_2_50_32_9]|nr:MAG: hypothetical protein COW67_02975 [Flavobacteriales bacterium CG18_big_fil_WC_8_21_14_2_50_32_9]
MARELTMNGNAKLKTIKKEFNNRFPYIRLSIYDLSEKGKSTKTPLDAEKTISEVRTVKSSDSVTIRGGQKVSNLEKMMEKTFGLYCQVAYTTKSGDRYYTSGNLDDMTLRDINKLGEKDGWKKDIAN